MAISVIDNFTVNTTKNIDSRLGPYASVAEATGSISTLLRYVGMTVTITGSGAPVEYWFSPTTASTDLTLKAFATSSFASSSVSSSYALTASYVQTAQTASYVLSASYAATASVAPLYLPLSGGTISGNLTINGTASISYLNVVYETASVILSTGSNQLGDAANDIQTLYGSVIIPTGSLTITGSTTSTAGFTGSLLGTSSWANNASTASYVTGSIHTSANPALSASYAVSTSFAALSQTANTASYVLQAVSASFVSTASYVTGSIHNSTNPALSASYALTASYALGSTSASYATTASFVQNAQTASYILNAVSSSYATTSSLSLRGIVTASANNTTITFTKGDGSTFDVTVSQSGSVATASYASFAATAATASYVTSSNVYGPYGSNSILSSSYALTASYALNGGGGTPGGSNTQIQFNANGVFSGSSALTFNSASNTLLLTGSLNITGSTTQIGNNSLLGNTTLSGSIIISGSTASPTVQIYGNTTHNGYIRFDPVTTDINQSISASYVYVSGSTNDLYFTQNGSGYNNTTRLRWLEGGSLYTGLLRGGIISSTPGTTTFNISSGSGLIVTMNASTGSEPYPTVQYVSWPTFTAQPIQYSGSAKITYLGISSAGTIVQQTIPWGTSDINQWDNSINLGVVLHLSGSVSTGVFNSPQISYGGQQKTDDFFRAFGPLKISGHTLKASGSTLSIIKDAGTSYREGANYVNNANHPSTVIENSISTSKIYRYYISGSTPVIDTGVGAAGYTVIDPTKYVDTTTGNLATVTGGQYSLQRVFWIPNSPTNAFIVYYGNNKYNSLTDAVNAQYTEPFTEAPNTAQNAILLGYIALNGSTTNLTTAADATIIQGGLFRSINGIGASGTNYVSTTLAGLADVSINPNPPAKGDLLVYGAAGDSQWNNSKQLTGSYGITGSLSVSQSLDTSARTLLIPGGIAVLHWNDLALYDYNASSSLAWSERILSDIYSINSANWGDRLLYDASGIQVMNWGTTTLYDDTTQESLVWGARVLLDEGGWSSLNWNDRTLFDSSEIRSIDWQSRTLKDISGSASIDWSVPGNVTTQRLYVSGAITGTNGLTLLGGNITTTGFVSASLGFTGSLFGTASRANIATSSSFASTASYIATAQTASYVATASYVTGAIHNSTNPALSASYAATASYILQTISASFASTASSINTLNQNVLITGSVTIGSSSFGSSENTLTLGPSLAGGSGEGGQLGLNAVGGTYTSASFIDVWQNYVRILRGSNASSDALVTQWNLHTKQMQLPAYTNASAFTGTATANLAVDSSGNVITVSTTGGTVFPYAGNAVITGSLTTTGVIYAQPNGGMYFQGGDDAALYDINVSNHIGIYGVQDSTVGSIKLGSGGGIISGKSGRIGIGTTDPVSGSLEVNGNVYAASFTGSLLGTASYATRALSSSFTTTSSYALTAQTASYVLQAVSASYATLAQTANTASYYGGSVVSASYASSSTSASYALTASYALNGVIINNNTANYLVTATGTANTLQGQSNMTYDSINSRLRILGNINLGAITTNTVAGTNAMAMGRGLTASGDYSLAHGYGNAATGQYSHAQGGGFSAGEGTLASGEASHAEGQSTIASGLGAHAEGYYTVASGSYSHAEGQYTTAYGDISHAEGFNTVANGIISHAEGDSTIANGILSHVEGQGTIANGYSSHAEGQGTIANGYSSHAEGYYTITNDLYQHAQGTYNLPVSGAGAFILGNGIDDLNRSNLIFASGSLVQITGSVIATQGFTGSLQGTSSWASNAVTASYITQAISASYASSSTSASYALTASYAMNGGGSGNAFPYTGSALITGSLGITGSLSVSQSLDTSTRQLYNSSNIATVDWGSNTLIDSDSVQSLSWNERSLIDAIGNNAIEWDGRRLIDSASIISVQWNDRTLKGPSGNTTLDWSVNNRISITGSVIATQGFSGSFSGSFFGNGAGLTGITATADTTAIEAQVWFLT